MSRVAAWLEQIHSVNEPETDDERRVFNGYLRYVGREVTQAEFTELVRHIRTGTVKSRWITTMIMLQDWQRKAELRQWLRFVKRR